MHFRMTNTKHIQIIVSITNNSSNMQPLTNAQSHQKTHKCPWKFKEKRIGFWRCSFRVIDSKNGGVCLGHLQYMFPLLQSVPSHLLQ